MNYTLKTTEQKPKKEETLSNALGKIVPLLAGEQKNIIIAFIAIFINSASNLIGPVIIAYTVDTFIQEKNFSGVLLFSALLLGIYALGMVASYVQTISMGGVGRRVLFKLRNALFTKIQELPIAFFNENKVGDLISRINNDTDKLNQFFSHALMQFFGNFFLILGSGILLLNLHFQLGVAALLPALLVLIISQIISAWVKRRNVKSLQSLGSLTAEIQESLENFKVIVAFNRQDYFRKKFHDANETNYSASLSAGIASNVFIPLYGLASNLAQIIVLAFGIYLISTGNFTIGLLIGFLLYVNNFYTPLRQLASVWSSFQLALAALDRISEILSFMPDITVISGEKAEKRESELIMEFKDVSFGYPSKAGEKVLQNINLELKKGAIYAFVGPTGGGKTTMTLLMSRLYDPTEGIIFLDGKDLRSYEPSERTKKIGFILQEPFLFTGTVQENILYGNTEYLAFSDEELEKTLANSHLSKLLLRFDEGLKTPITANGNTTSLGQKQLIAFMRAILREPEILILDEATANIDTVTEQLLEEILNTLPKETTKIIIAHRLNTISSADQVYFVNGGGITLAGSLQSAVEMLMHGERKS
ncbi:MAG: ABC transporter ATP-binding protein [Candidatus Peregrinibacteria bacterium]